MRVNLYKLIRNSTQFLSAGCPELLQARGIRHTVLSRSVFSRRLLRPASSYLQLHSVTVTLQLWPVLFQLHHCTHFRLLLKSVSLFLTWQVFIEYSFVRFSCHFLNLCSHYYYTKLLGNGRYLACTIDDLFLFILS